MVRFENVNKKFAVSAFTISDVSFEIKDGEFVFITGPSGAGKTTILRLIIRDLVPNSGKIFLNSWELFKLKGGDISKLRQKVTMVFQDFRLLSDRTVFENVAIALELRGVGDKEIEKKVKNVLELTSLSNQTNLFPAQLAGGELQRTCLARALVGKPDVILADEPTGNLDPATGWEILKLLTQINKMGTTVIMATHNVDIVNSLGKRVITLDKGKIVKDEKEGKYEIS
ncbi:MAG: cell division transport system ATP-binding protein [Microgenomates group bacterium LiPW_16]|nr:MAG: cell division transport system ATP-binding protein [Microgenomates group bacterium LiPW_16]